MSRPVSRAARADRVLTALLVLALIVAGSALVLVVG